jgi:hypothetical protein
MQTPHRTTVLHWMSGTSASLFVDKEKVKVNLSHLCLFTMVRGVLIHPMGKEYVNILMEPSTAAPSLRATDTVAAFRLGTVVVMCTTETLKQTLSVDSVYGSMVMAALLKVSSDAESRMVYAPVMKQLVGVATSDAWKGE